MEMKRRSKTGNKGVWIFKNNGQGVVASVIMLIVIGTLNIYSSTFVANSWSIIGKHLIILAISVALSIGFYYKCDYHILKNNNVLKLLMGGTILMLLAVYFGGVVVNGARRWLLVPFINLQIQPSEFAKLVGILWAAACVSRSLDKKQKVDLFESPKKNPFILTMALLLPVVCAGLTIAQPDMGTAVLIIMLPMAILLIGGMNFKLFCKLLGFAVVVGAAFAWSSPYRRERLISLYDPWSHASNLGYQSVQGLLAIGSGGIWGEGFAQGSSKYFYLPEAHTDYAFAVLAQEWGLLGTLLVVFLVAMFTFFGLRIATQSRDYFGSLTAFGITFLISGQAIFNMLMVSGLMPVTGVPLPFVSYGGSSLLINVMAVGILASIAKETDQVNKPIGQEVQQASLREEVRSRYRPRSTMRQAR